ncbi:MAG: RNA polymerase sigma factor [Porticoccaceae bacterium]
MEKQWLKLEARLKAYLGRILKRPEDVEDITQESFARVLEAGSKGKIEYPKAYLYRTARNLALNAVTKKSYQLEDFIEDLQDSTVIEDEVTLEDQVIAQRRFELFCRATAELPDQCRRVLILCRVYGLSMREVSERLGISISTAEKHLAKGLLRCAAYMENHEGNSQAKDRDAGSRRRTL